MRLLLASLALAAACTTTRPQVRRVCPPLAKVTQARTVSLRTNVLLQCGTGPLSEQEAIARLRKQLGAALPHVRVVDGVPSDLHVIVTITDYVPEKFHCVSPAWHWTGGIYTFLQRPDQPSAQSTFVQLAEITGTAPSRTAGYARGFARAFARVAADPAAVPPSTIRCVSDGWFPEER